MLLQCLGAVWIETNYGGTVGEIRRIILSDGPFISLVKKAVLNITVFLLIKNAVPGYVAILVIQGIIKPLRICTCGGQQKNDRDQKKFHYRMVDRLVISIIDEGVVFFKIRQLWQLQKIFFSEYRNSVTFAAHYKVRVVAQPGSALVWGARGRWFESSPPDTIVKGSNRCLYCYYSKEHYLSATFFT